MTLRENLSHAKELLPAKPFWRLFVQSRDIRNPRRRISHIIHTLRSSPLPRLLWAVAALLSLAVQGMAQRGGAVTPRRVAPATIASARAGEGAPKQETTRVSLIGGNSTFFRAG